MKYFLMECVLLFLLSATLHSFPQSLEPAVRDQVQAGVAALKAGDLTAAQREPQIGGSSRQSGTCILRCPPVSTCHPSVSRGIKAGAHACHRPVVPAAQPGCCWPVPRGHPGTES